MAKDKEENKDKSKPDKPKMPILMSSKLFIKKIKAELKGENISPSVFIAFVSTINPSIDSEENFRKKWKTTFKRS